MTTSTVSVFGKVSSECLITLDLTPCTIIGPSRKIVKESFNIKLEVACGVRSPKTLKVIYQEEILTEVKLPKLYTDVNYDITYGVQTLQILSYRMGDIMGNTGEYMSLTGAFKLASQEMIHTAVKVIVSFASLYMAWMMLISGMSAVAIPLICLSILPWVIADDESLNASNNIEFFFTISALVLAWLTKKNKDRLVQAVTFTQYLGQIALRKLATSSMLDDEYHTARLIIQGVQLILLWHVTESFVRFLQGVLIVNVMSNISTTIRDFWTNIFYGSDVNFESENSDTLSILIAKLVPNKKWYNDSTVCINGMGSPNRALNNRFINKQFLYKATLRSAEPQVFMHEVVKYFEDNELPKEFGTCVWNKIDGTITGAKHTLKFCGCYRCVNHNCSFDVVGKIRGDEAHIEESDTIPTFKSGKWDQNKGVYHGHYTKDGKYYLVYNNVREDSEDAHLRNFNRDTQTSIKICQNMEYKSDGLGRKEGEFMREKGYGNLAEVDNYSVRTPTSHMIGMRFSTYPYSDTEQSYFINVNVRATIIKYDGKNHVIIAKEYIVPGILEKYDLQVRIFGAYASVARESPCYRGIVLEYTKGTTWETFSPCMSYFKIAPSARKISYLEEVLNVKGLNKVVGGAIWSEINGVVFTAAHTARTDWIGTSPQLVTTIGDVIFLDTKLEGRVKSFKSIPGGSYKAKVEGKEFRAEVQRKTKYIKYEITCGDRKVSHSGMSGTCFRKDDNYFVVTIGDGEYQYTELMTNPPVTTISLIAVNNKHPLKKQYETKWVGLEDQVAVLSGNREQSTLITSVTALLPAEAIKWRDSYHTSNLSFNCDTKQNQVYERHISGIKCAPHKYICNIGDFIATAVKTESDGVYKIIMTETIGEPPAIWQDQYGIWHCQKQEQIVIPYSKFNNGEKNVGTPWQVVYNSIVSPINKKNKMPASHSYKRI